MLLTGTFNVPNCQLIVGVERNKLSGTWHISELFQVLNLSSRATAVFSPRSLIAFHWTIIGNKGWGNSFCTGRGFLVLFDSPVPAPMRFRVCKIPSAKRTVFPEYQITNHRTQPDGTRWLSPLVFLLAGSSTNNRFHPTIKFTAEISDKEVTFPDPIVYKGARFDNQSILDIRTHFKPTETFP